MDSNYKQRLSSPTKAKQQSPPRKQHLGKTSVYYDRHIPAGTPKQLRDSFYLLDLEQPEKKTPKFEGAQDHSTYHQILKNEILGSPFGLGASPKASPARLFSYSRKEQPLDDSLYSLSPLGLRSQTLLSSPKKAPRKIPKVLEAPSIQDDFYLNLLDWSSQNVLAVALNQSMYLWNASTSMVSKLCDLPGGDYIASVSWMARGSHLAIGSSQGTVALWDVAAQKQIRTFSGHKSRVGTLSWSNSSKWLLSSGSRDRSILHHDIRTQSTAGKLIGHKQEVCGLKWGYNPTSYLASGGNDNKLLIWDQRAMNTNSTSTIESTSGATQPIHTFSSHKAAVKAVTWSPHQRGILASGGGTADQHIRFWNAVSGQEMHSIDTGSQVCNIAWSKNVNELVSTHGFSQNQISVWHYPSMTEVASLTGHTSRVLYLAVSPDGQTIVTGAGDQTLRFWSLFPQAPTSSAPTGQLHSLLNPLHEIR